MQRRPTDKVVTTMLAQHLKAGNIRRVARGVFASAPAHRHASDLVVDRFLAASRLRADAVIAYHSALELHGCAYTDAPDVQALPRAEPTTFETQDLACRFLRLPKGFVAARDVVQLDRQGLAVDVTTLERPLADCFDRHDLAGGAEELINSLALVECLKTDELFRQARGLRNASAAGALGWWLEREQTRLGVPDKTLAARSLVWPRWRAARPSARAVCVLPVPLRSSAMTFPRFSIHSHRASSSTSALLSDGWAVSPKQPGAGQPHARICEGEAEWPSSSTATRICSPGGSPALTALAGPARRQ